MVSPIAAYSLLAVYYLILVLLSLFSFHRYHMLYLYYKNCPRGKRPVAPVGNTPLVTIQLPIYNEKFVARRLIEAFERLDYPKSSVQIQVLDDSTDDTCDIAKAAVERMRGLGWEMEYIHRTNRSGFKAGALENGLRTARGEFIAIFDADFLPPTDFLRRALPLFTSDKIGMVQMRWDHLNREDSALTQCQSMMLDGHFVIEHAARHFSGRFFNFNGTAGIWRRAAIEDAGGWQHDTLTEDLDLSYRAQLKGWQFVYAPYIAAPGELPAEMNAFKTQQHRWTKGSIQVALKLLPQIWRSREPFKVKAEATFHLCNNFAYLLLLMMALLMLPVLWIRQSFSINIPFWFDLFLFCGATLSMGTFYLAAQREILGGWMRQIRYIPLMMSLGIGLCVNNARAVLEALFGIQTSFVRTPKMGDGVQSGGARAQNPYITRNTLIALIETALAIHFIGVIIYCIQQKNYISVPFMMLFLVGFGYVGVLSLAASVKRRPAAVPVHSSAV